MASFLIATAVFVLAMAALSLIRILRGPGNAERMMAAQLIGSSGVAALLLLSMATDEPAVIDVAMMLALLAAFASVGFVKRTTAAEPPSREAADP